MTARFLLSILSKIFAFVGLSLDLFGLLRLFKFEPKPLNEVNENVLEATLVDYVDLEKVK
jgi:hypothetical protein|tara:strand:+ start:102 stop:281 length:180 start_codon:yes stop_codon:yes gene_type:complete